MFKDMLKRATAEVMRSRSHGRDKPWKSGKKYGYDRDRDGRDDRGRYDDGRHREDGGYRGGYGRHGGGVKGMLLDALTSLLSRRR